MESIHRSEFKHADRMAAQEAAISAVLGDPEGMKARYKLDPCAFNGRYVGADLAKELFPVYTQSREARNRYTSPIHNAAAVLAADLYQDALRNRSPEQDKAVFLTGSPGAGKTTKVMLDGQIALDTAVVFEGQLFRAEQSFPKLDAAIAAGVRPCVVAVHPRPEVALENTFRRFDEVGRGASIQTMALIQGELHQGLAQIHSRYGEAVSLTIHDVRDPANAQQLDGWGHLQRLESEGNKDAIQRRLASHLQRHREAGTITDACYQQAIGAAPVAERLSDRGMDRQFLDPDAGSRPEPRPALSAQAAQLLISTTRDRPALSSSELARAHFIARQDPSWAEAYERRHGPDIAKYSHSLARQHGQVLAATVMNLHPREAAKAFPELAAPLGAAAAAVAAVREQGQSPQAVQAVAGKLLHRVANDLAQGTLTRAPDVRREQSTPPPARGLDGPSR